MKNTGKEYEKFVARLQQALLNAEPYTQQKNIQVEVNKIIVDNCGAKREFDIYWEYELAGITYKTVIECKDYNSNIAPEKIDALIGKIKDFPDLKPVFATKKGYASGAIAKAKHNKIELLIVREQNDSDWISKDGSPLLKKIHLNSIMHSPAQIRRFDVFIDREWFKDQSFKEEQLKSFSGYSQNNETFIENIAKGTTFSLLELTKELKPLDGKEYGVFKKTVQLENAFVHDSHIKLKISAYKIEYSIPKPISDFTVIDYSQQLIGVIEYLQKGTKKPIFKNDIIQ